MATLGIEPPSYHPPLGSGHTDNEPPEYSRNAAADERIVLSQPTAPQPSTTDVREYHFHSERLELNVGPTKYYPVKVSTLIPGSEGSSFTNLLRFPVMDGMAL